MPDFFFQPIFSEEEEYQGQSQSETKTAPSLPVIGLDHGILICCVLVMICATDKHTDQLNVRDICATKENV